MSFVEVIENRAGTPHMLLHDDDLCRRFILPDAHVLRAKELQVASPPPGTESDSVTAPECLSGEYVCNGGGNSDC